MENGLTKFQNNIKENTNVVTVFLVFAEIIFVIVMVGILRSILEEPYIVPQVGITNFFEKIQDLPAESGEEIKEELYGVAALNSGALANIEDSGATIRENTIVNKYFKTINMHYVNFIVDIPSTQQSYQIFHEWSDDGNNPYFVADNSTLVMCPTKDKMVYDDFKCVDNSNRRGRYFVVETFKDMGVFSVEDWSLIGYGVVSPTNKWNVTLDDSYIGINVVACGDERKKNIAVADVNEYFKILGYDLTEFDYKIEDACQD